MKHLILLLLNINLCILYSFSQISSGINYQAVARDESGKELYNKSITMRFSILNGNINGSLVWQEMHNITTNQYGLFTLLIGQGQSTGAGSSPSFNEIKWGDGAHFLKVEIKNGQDFSTIGNSQMAYVPYAMYALNAKNCENKEIDITYNPANNLLYVNNVVKADLSYLIDNITYNPSTFKLYRNSTEIADLSGLQGGSGSGNSVTDIKLSGSNLVFTRNNQEFQVPLSALFDNTDEQSLSIDGYKLSLTRKNQNPSELTLPKQTLYAKQNTLRLSNDSSTVNFDPDSGNELQTLWINFDTLELRRTNSGIIDSKIPLSIELSEERDTFYLKNSPKSRKISLRNDLTVLPNNKLNIFRGNTVDIDTDPRNEIQNLTLSDDFLTISKDTTTNSKVNLHTNFTKLPGNKLTITRGDTVSIDTDPANEIQDLTLTDNKLKITNNTSAKEIDLSPYKDNTDNQTLSYRSSDTSLVITTRDINGTSGTSSLNVSNMVNVPWVGFSCHNSADYSLNGLEKYTIPWNEEFDDGNSLNTTVFTANAAGVYNFSLSFSFASINGLTLRILKGTQVFKSFEIKSNNYSTNLLIKLNQGETITVVLLNGESYPQQLLDAYFSGYRVH